MKIKFAIPLLCILTLAITITAHANAPVNITINGDYQDFDVPAQIINDRTMLPLRSIAEALDLTVSHDPATNTATLTQHSNTIIHEIGTATITVNGVSATFDTPSTIIQGRTLVPVRMLAEAVNAHVEWQPRTSTAAITTMPPMPHQTRISLNLFLLDHHSLFGVSPSTSAEITGNQYRLFDAYGNPLVATDFTLFASYGAGTPGVVVDYHHAYGNGVVRHRFYVYCMTRERFRLAYETELHGGLGRFRTDNQGNLFVLSFDTQEGGRADVWQLSASTAGIQRQLLAEWEQEDETWQTAVYQWESQGFDLHNYPIPGRADVWMPTTTPWSLLQDSVTEATIQFFRAAGLVE